MIIGCRDGQLNSDHVLKFYASLTGSAMDPFCICAEIAADHSTTVMAVYKSSEDAGMALTKLWRAFSEGRKTFAMPDYSEGNDNGQTD